ncbi:galactosyldiacylglycerol synthase [Aciduricibacillus chroicocephali]|uniref:Galactosyldiacylglycerol synthase n=1 Tax=Aciduricibacillus chroicocephali TaxID=3054939 RepID=A0ABY9L0H6_9BACI|nr:galactosyldiacylglycerol synthase [Bacillaceae bacterium 44XB]
MKKILFFPHLRMQSGHHQAAEALMDLLSERLPDAEMKKIDLITETNTLLEKMISEGYMKWIHHAPASYDFVYKHLFYDSISNEHQFKWYQPLFMRKMRQILKREQPDLVVCTHSFPSSIISKLKMRGECDVPVVNAYTDLFINCVWGRDGIDAHLLPTDQSKKNLERNHPKPRGMAVTGIPVHPEIKRTDCRDITAFKDSEHPIVLVAGGNSGIGRIDNLFEQLKQSQQFHFKVLCGHNKRLHAEIEAWNLEHIEALPYISSRSEMNDLYDCADAMITKPGGVTVSEGLRKCLPMFIHSALPGQEEINMDYLVPHGLVFELQPREEIESQLRHVLMDETRMHRFQQAVSRYRDAIDLKSDDEVFRFIIRLLEPETEKVMEVGSKAGFLFPVQE